MQPCIHVGVCCPMGIRRVEHARSVFAVLLSGSCTSESDGSGRADTSRRSRPTAAKRSEPRGPHAGAASKCVRRHDRLVCHSVPLIFSIQDWTIDTALGFCCFGHCDCTSSSYSVVYTSPMTSHAIVSSLTTVALNV